MKKLLIYFRDSVEELSHVTWPKQEQLLRLTTITVIFVIIAAIILAILDFSFTSSYQWFLSLFP